MLRLHPRLAPVKVGGAAAGPQGRASPRWRREVYEALRRRMPAEYDEGGSIGRRYRRQDEIGTPWAVTVDHQTAEDPQSDVVDLCRRAKAHFASRLDQTLPTRWAEAFEK